MEIWTITSSIIIFLITMCLLFYAFECRTFRTLWSNKREKETVAVSKDFHWIELGMCEIFYVHQIKSSWNLWQQSRTWLHIMSQALHGSLILPCNAILCFFFLHFKQHMWYVLYDTARIIHIKNILSYWSLI